MKTAVGPESIKIEKLLKENRNPVRLTNKERKSYLSYQQFKHQWRKVQQGKEQEI